MTPPPPAQSDEPTVVAVMSLKGGVGKTSVVLGLAGAALERGLPTLVVDLDPQGNATSALDPVAAPYSISDVLHDARAGIAADAVVDSCWGREIKLIPSERALEHRAAETGPRSERRLRTALLGVTSGFRLVLIDCPPNLGELTRNALYAADQALVITEPSFFAVQSAAQSIEAIEVAQGAGHTDLRLLGILATRVRPRFAEHRYRLRELNEAFGDVVLPPIPDRTAIQQAQGSCVPVQRWRSQSAKAASAAFEELLDLALAPGPAAPVKKR
ncbi:MAG: ParA family protein [Candidatus Nanopelagicales bacterium]